MDKGAKLSKFPAKITGIFCRDNRHYYDIAQTCIGNGSGIAGLRTAFSSASIELPLAASVERHVQGQHRLQGQSPGLGTVQDHAFQTGCEEGHAQKSREVTRRAATPLACKVLDRRSLAQKEPPQRVKRASTVILMPASVISNWSSRPRRAA